MVIKKTTRGIKLIDNVARINPKALNIISTIFVFAAFATMIYGTYLILMSSQMVLDRIITKPALQLILPIAQNKPINGVGFIGVPFWFWILVVPFVMFPHEFAHGIVSRANKVRIKNVGLIQLLIFSGAFVEPDDNDLRKASLMSKLRIFSAGSMTNIFLALLLLIVSRSILWPLVVPEGVLIIDVLENTGAETAGLKSGMILQKIGNNKIETTYDDFIFSYSYLLISAKNLTTQNLKTLPTSIEIGNAIYDFSPNETIEVVADGKIYNVVLSGRPENSSLPYIGIIGDGVRTNDFMMSFLFPLLWWLTNISYFVAIFNLLPIYPLDGGLMVEAVIEKLSKKYKDLATKYLTWIMISLLLFNFIGPSILSFF